ncbi:glycosyltransferase [Candidatus Parcubacteria bacterium]|jgi:glycosyltransferase involved in cell wall biosynthesis|nr:MAG: glycosyltransferase [Candidatus Parcubacteria bacterium]
MPEISVIIPTYNYAQYIIETLESVINQTFKDLEIIVVDDGSTDDTKKVLEPYIQAKTIKYIYQNNQGLAAARNTGIKNSQGRSITFLDSDDLFTNDKLLTLRAALKNSPDMAMAYGNHLLWTGQKIYKKPRFSNGRAPSGWILPQLFLKPLMSVPTVLVERKCFEKVGLFNETLSTGEDWEMWQRIAAEFQIMYVDKITAYVRVHPKSMSTNFIKMGENKLKIKQSIYFRYQSKLLANLSQRDIDRSFSEIYIDLSKHQILQGSKQVARKYLKCAYGLDKKSFIRNSWLLLATYMQTLTKILYRIKMSLLNFLTVSDKNLNEKK